VVVDHRLDALARNRLLLLTDTQHRTSDERHVEAPVEPGKVVQALFVEALVEGIGGAEDRVNQGPVEHVQRADCTDPQAANFAPFECGQVTDLAFVFSVLREPVDAIEH
jgi:hypothetical protein